MAAVTMKVISSLEKCFLDEKVEDKRARDHYLMLRNERLSFQVIFEQEDYDIVKTPFIKVALEGVLAKYATVREVVSVPSHFASCRKPEEKYYIRTAPGLYPDLLRPFLYDGYLRLPHGQTRSIMIDIEIPKGENVPCEETALQISLIEKKRNIVLGSVEAFVRVIDVSLPKQKLIHTEWFYTDCVAEAHHCKPFSEKHWKMCEKYIRTATRNGVNMILTPVFTPELDTYVGGERLTTQLVDITVESDGSYSFNFKKLGRWIDMCLGCGIEYFEIPHFFTQWGATAAPKFVACVNGRTKRIFGWETDSMGDEYGAFLAAFIPALVSYFKEKGVDRRCFYHISDEPSLKDFDKYLQCKERVAPYLEGYNIIDALSDIEFYHKGVLPKPVPMIANIQPFLDEKIDGLWAYYCAGDAKTTDRYLSMPLAHTRILGVQLYKHNIEGFLHWGYNFYHSTFSYDYVDPLGNTDGEGFSPSGNMFVVYPGTNNEVWESIRLNALREATDDMRALELCESVCGKDFVDSLIDDISFFAFPDDPEYLLSLRDKIALVLEEKLVK